MEKDLNYYLNLPYTMEIIPNPEGEYSARIVELPGCIAQGKTVDAVNEALEETKRNWIQGAIENGTEIPEPVYQDFSGRFVLRMPKSLHRALSKLAHKEKVSLNHYVIYKLAEIIGLEKRKASDQ